MPAVVRAGDPLTTGHLCDATSTLDAPTTGLANSVFANGIGIACVGDLTVVHMAFGPPPSCSPHTGSINAGSGTVFIAGTPVARVGDSVDLGTMTAGSSDVFAG